PPQFPGAGPGQYPTPGQVTYQPAESYGPGTQYGPHEPGGPSEPPAPPGTAPDQPRKSRRGLYAILIALGAVVVLAVAAVLVITLLSGAGGNSYAVGSCVSRSGDAAAATKCSDAKAYKITQKVDNKDRCDG